MNNYDSKGNWKETALYGKHNKRLHETKLELAMLSSLEVLMKPELKQYAKILDIDARSEYRKEPRKHAYIAALRPSRAEGLIFLRANNGREQQARRQKIRDALQRKNLKFMSRAELKKVASQLGILKSVEMTTKAIQSALQKELDSPSKPKATSTRNKPKRKKPQERRKSKEPAPKRRKIKKK